MTTSQRKLLLVGWDSADWKVIHPLMDAGKMPHLQQLINGGVIGNLATLYPVLSPMLWTSIATGKRPMKHGIHGFAEPDPHTGGIRPITNLSRQTKAVWNILAQEGKKCVVVGWWPSSPAEPLPDGVMVSNHYQRAPHPDPAQPWPMPKGTVHPERLNEALAELRLHPGELDGAHILPFVPNAEKIDQAKDRRLEALAKTIADCTSIQAAATHLIATEPWDFMAVYFDAIDHFGHGFMRYHPPKQTQVSDEDFAMYQGVIEAAYRYHDMMLGVLMAMAGPDATILLMSDHGFHPDHLRPAAIPLEPAGPAVEHRHYGIFALSGPGIKRDERIYGATVLDICPTLLTLFGLPVGRDMDGKPLVTVFDQPPPMASIPSWDQVSGQDGMHPVGTRLDAGEAKEALKQLEALGYISPLPDDQEKAVAETTRELRYNLACAHTDANQHEAAAAIFAELWGHAPEEHRFGAKLLTSQLALGRHPAARLTLETLRANRKKYAALAATELRALREKLKDVKPDDLKPQDREQLHRLAVTSRLTPAPMLQMEAMLLSAEGRPEASFEILGKLKESGRLQPDFLVQLGNGSLSLKRYDEAEQSYREALALDPDHALAHHGLAQVNLALRRNYEAAGSALTSVGLLYHNPSAHFVLGVALHRLNRIDRAVEALKVCLSQNPNFLLAHRRLALIYANRLKDPAKAAEHHEHFRIGLERLKKQRRSVAVAAEPTHGPSVKALAVSAPFDPLSLAPARSDLAATIIVSGLPRSGTSLMMQMLVAGGIPALHDGQRPADDDNPRGYFEFAPAKNLRADASWLPHAKGRVLKLVAQLLPFLPIGPSYKMIFMERTLEEVLASQQVMLDRHGRAGAALSPEKLRQVYEQQLARVNEMLTQRKIPVLRVTHGDAVRDPVATAARVAEFIDLPLDRPAMAAAIDPTLHRQKKA